MVFFIWRVCFVAPEMGGQVCWHSDLVVVIIINCFNKENSLRFPSRVDARKAPTLGKSNTRILNLKELGFDSSRTMPYDARPAK